MTRSSFMTSARSYGPLAFGLLLSLLMPEQRPLLGVIGFIVGVGVVWSLLRLRSHDGRPIDFISKQATKKQRKDLRILGFLALAFCAGGGAYILWSVLGMNSHPHLPQWLPTLMGYFGGMLMGLSTFSVLLIRKANA